MREWRKLGLKSITLALLLALMVSFFANAEDAFKGLKLDLGYTWGKLNGTITAGTNPSTDIGVLNVTNPSGIWISLEKNVYNPRTSLGLAYYNLRDEGTATLTSNIFLPDSSTGGAVLFPAGSTVNTTLEYTAVDIYYKSFLVPYTPESGGIYFLGGLRFNKFKGISDDGINRAEYNVNVPTFYLGLGGDYRLADNLRAFFSLGGFTGSSSQGKGNLFEYEVGANLDMSENTALGLAYRYQKYNLEDSSGNKADLSFKGFRAYLKIKF